MPLNAVESLKLINQSSINLNQSNSSAQIYRGHGDGANVTVNARDLALTTGQTFSGQVIEVNGNEVKLQLDGNQTINARLDGNLNAILGQVISFEVSSTEGGQTSLRPLYTNLSNMTAISNALRSAGLPETAQYVRMVSSMMDESMPVNKDALWNMSKDVLSFPKADPQTIVQMTKLSLPINELSVNQMENYKGFEHGIKNDVMNLTNGLVDFMDDSLVSANPEFYEQLAASQLKNAGVEGSITQRMNDLFSALKNVVAGNDENNKAAVINDNAALNQEIAEEHESGLVKEEPFNTSGLKIAGEVINLVDTDSELFNTQLTDGLNRIIDNMLNSREATGQDNISDDIEKTNQTAEAVTDGQLNSNEENVNASIQDAKTYTFNETLNIVKNLISNINENENSIPNETKRLLSELLSNDEFKDNLKNGLTSQLSLKPGDVTSTGKIEEAYNKILRQSEAILDVLKNAGKENPEMAKAAQNINDSVTFMNQLNQAVTYIQLPLLMNNKSAHGDLYVYTNKKNLKEKDGNISALLHLDMDNLGPMDVYIGLTNGTKVNTHFYLQDDATIDFISEHIDMLNDRLTKKGYNMSTNVSVKGKNEKPVNMAEEFMKETPETVHRVAAKLSFDVRA